MISWKIQKRTPTIIFPIFLVVTFWIEVKNIDNLTFYLLFLNLLQIFAFLRTFYTFFQLIFVENFS